MGLLTGTDGNYAPGLVSEAASYTATSGGGGALSGSGAPDNSLGADGNLYVNLLTGDVYSKSSGAWNIVSGGSGGGATSGNGDPNLTVDPAQYVLFVQLDSDPPMEIWASDGVTWT